MQDLQGWTHFMAQYKYGIKEHAPHLVIYVVACTPMTSEKVCCCKPMQGTLDMTAQGHTCANTFFVTTAAAKLASCCAGQV